MAAVTVVHRQQLRFITDRKRVRIPISFHLYGTDTHVCCSYMWIDAVEHVGPLTCWEPHAPGCVWPWSISDQYSSRPNISSREMMSIHWYQESIFNLDTETVRSEWPKLKHQVKFQRYVSRGLVPTQRARCFFFPILSMLHVHIVKLIKLFKKKTELGKDKCQSITFAVRAKRHNVSTVY